MAKKEISDYSTEELKSNEKTLKVVVYILMVILVIYGITMFYLMFTGGWQAQNPVIVMPFFLFVIMVLVNSKRSKVQAELKRRVQ